MYGKGATTTMRTLGLVTVSLAVIAGVASTSCADDTKAGRLLEAIVSNARAGGGTTEHVVSSTGYSVLVVSSPIDESKLANAGVTSREIKALLTTRPETFKAAVAVFDFDGFTVSWYLGEFVSVEHTMRVEKNGGTAVRLVVDSSGQQPVLRAIE